MLIQPVVPYVGQHCETTATGTLLLQHGISLSEPMLFGLGEGLSFMLWQSKAMALPFLGGRVKPDAITRTLAERLHLQLDVHETTSATKAWARVKQCIDTGQAVGLKLDLYHLEYFTRPFHFAGHYVALVGYDEHQAYLVDTQPQGGLVQTSLASLARARAEKGPMSSRNLSYSLTPTGRPRDLKQAVATSLRNNARAYLSPPINNISYKGIQTTAKRLLPWFQRSTDRKDFCITAQLMEKAGSGGALFRNLYRDFLQESAQLLENEGLQQAHALFATVAAQWTQVAHALHQAGTTEDVRFIHEAAALLLNIADKEQQAMQLIVTLSFSK